MRDSSEKVIKLVTKLKKLRKNGLSTGRTVDKIEGIFGGGSMFKLPGAVSTRCQKCRSVCCTAEAPSGASRKRLLRVKNVLARQAPEGVSGCVFFLVNSARGSAGC